MNERNNVLWWFKDELYNVAQKKDTQQTSSPRKRAAELFNRSVKERILLRCSNNISHLNAQGSVVLRDQSIQVVSNSFSDTQRCSDICSWLSTL